MKPSFCATIAVGLGCYFSISCWVGRDSPCWGSHLADSGRCHSNRGGICSKQPKNFSFSLPFFFSFFFFCLFVFVFGRKIALGTVTGFFLCVFFLLLSSLLVFSTSPIFAFLERSSSCCCSCWCPALFPLPSWHVSLDHLLAPQKATCCSERARTASCPSLALNTEHMLSQLSRVWQQPSRTTLSPPACCLSAGISAGVAAGEGSRLWEEALCFTHSSIITGKKLHGFWDCGFPYPTVSAD